MKGKRYSPGYTEEDFAPYSFIHLVVLPLHEFLNIEEIGPPIIPDSRPGLLAIRISQFLNLKSIGTGLHERSWRKSVIEERASWLSDFISHIQSGWAPLSPSIAPFD